MPKLDDRITGLQEKLKQLKARQARIDARKRALAGSRARKDDTRRKILLGAAVLARIKRGELDQATVNAWLEVALTREDDRALFELSVGDDERIRTLQTTATSEEDVEWQ